MGKRIVIVILLLSAVQSFAGFTLVQREPFQGVGTLSSTNAGGLGTVVQGLFYSRAVGPRVSGDTTAQSLGWSAELRFDDTVATWPQHQQLIKTTAAASAGCWSLWLYLNRVVNNGANSCQLLQTRDNNGNQFLRLALNAATGTFWYNQGGAWANTDSSVAYPLNQWFELRQTWSLVSGSQYQFVCAYRLAGSTSWVTIHSGTLTFGDIIYDAQCLYQLAPSSGFFYGRYGMPAVYAISSFATDSTNLVSDVIDPPSGPITWYVNPASGADSNDGVSAASAWQTAGQVTTEGYWGGIFSAPTYSVGDTISIDTSSAALDETSSNLVIRTSGCNVKAAPGKYYTVKHASVIDHGDWVPSVSLAKTYQATNSVSLSCLWENDKWMNHPSGISFAAVSNALETVAGSFWTDGTIMYVHPFGDTDPRVDGKTYERSNPGAGAPLALLADNFNVSGLVTSKTCDVDPATTVSNGGYCVVTANGTTGTNVLSECLVTHSGKHGFGLVGDATNSVLSIIRCQSEQGSAYSDQSPWVSFMSSASATNNVHRYLDCTTLHGIGVIGSTNGTNSSFSSVLFSHNLGSGVNFSRIDVTRCNFPYGNIALGVAETVCISGGTNGIVAAYSLTNNVFNQVFFSANSAATNLTVNITNCLLVPNPLADFIGGQYIGAQVQGTYTVVGCTIDTSLLSNPDTPSRSYFLRTGPSTFAFENSVFITRGGNQYTPFGAFTNTDVVVDVNNVYQLGTSNWCSLNAYAAGNLTFSEWQGLGNGSNCVNRSACISSNYRPYAKTPCWTTGAELGPATDFTGKLFQSRRTAGAYEYVTPQPTLLMFGQ